MGVFGFDHPVPPRKRVVGSKSPVQQLLVQAASSPDPQAHFAPLVLAHCWLDSALEGDLYLTLKQGESIRAHLSAQSVVGFNPQWLFEVGYVVADSAGTVLGSADEPASAAGPIVWDPPVPLHRLDDQIDEKDKPVGSSDRNRRLAGEVLVTCLWRRSALAAGIDNSFVARGIKPNTRGARFRDDLKTFLTAVLIGWDFPHEKSLDTIYGLHLRQDVGERKSDILALDDSQPRRRLMAVISSKWSWRSDRGTEAAQMVPLRKYRPDLPYVIVTAEFPRARIVGRESVEDSAYHLAPDWVAAWLALYLQWGKVDWSGLTLAEAYDKGAALIDGLGLETLPALAASLKRAGLYG